MCVNPVYTEMDQNFYLDYISSISHLKDGIPIVSLCLSTTLT